MYHGDGFSAAGTGYPIVIRNATSPDGLTWTKDPNILIGSGYGGEAGWVGTPETMVLSDGTYRMYYSNEKYPFGDPQWGNIVSAVSPDGLTWTKEPNIRVDYGGPYDSLRVLSPDIMQLSDGTYRMYYAGYDYGGDEHYRILSAVSADGLTWTKETGVRVDIGGTYDTLETASPEVIQLPDETYIMFYRGYDGGTGRILSAVSTGGLAWTKEPGFRLEPNDLGIEGVASVAPGEIITLGDNEYRMYFSSDTGTTASGTERCKIFSAYVPEPATLSLLAFGGLVPMLSGLKRRWKS